MGFFIDFLIKNGVGRWMRRFKKKEMKISTTKSRPIEESCKDDGNSKFVFGWDPNRRPGLLSNHFLDFGVDLLWCVALNDGCV